MTTRIGSRSEAGQIFVNHKGHSIPTSVGSLQYEVVYGGDLETKFFPRTLGGIPAGFGHRPELIANLFLDTPNLWWVICERNAIFDVFEELKMGDTIYIPTIIE